MMMRMWTRPRVLGAAAIAALALSVAHAKDEVATTLPQLEAGFVVNDGDKPIDVTTGHAAPWLRDMDGDGKPDLVVGQFEDGKARVYLNKGTATAPKFSGFTWLQAGGQDATVPFG
jgi:hypothetical protein